MAASWPWLTLAGLGAFHGLNPAMGWLFAVALGLNRKSFGAVLLALPPIALGHALSIALIAAAVAAAGIYIEPRIVRMCAGLLLLCWAIYHTIYGHSQRVRVGMTAGVVGLAFWSFMMAAAHGAGLMLLPALMPVCFTPASGSGAATPFLLSLAAVAVHTGAMLTVAGLIAVAVYRWIGLAILRTAWFNLDKVWTAALAGTGVLLLVFPFSH
jgi:hypothetical protein